MNPQTHRLIFNKARGCLMAVGEHARSSVRGCSGVRRSKRQCSTASNVLADQNVDLKAGGNVKIEAAQNTQSQTDYRQVTKSGLMSGGGIGFTVGKRQQSLDQQGQSTTAAASTIGSTGGNVTISAGQTFTQTGSDVLTPAGDIAITAKAVDINEARETGSQSTEQKFKQSGLTVAVTSPVISALQTASSQLQAAGNTGSGRMQALAAANAAMNLKQAADALKAGQGDANGMVRTGAQNPDGTPKTNADGTPETKQGNAADKAGGIGISLSLGSSSSNSTSQSSADSARSSNLTAGGNIRIAATGDGQNSNLTVQGSSVKAAGTTTLKADNQVNLLAAQNTTNESSSNQSKSGSVGVAMQLGAGGGAGAGIGFTASASKATGQGAGNGVTYTNSQVAGSTVTIESGGDTNLKGAVVAGQQVTAKVGGNLNIQSLQDSNQYKDKSQSVGGSVMVGITSTGPASGNLSLGQTKINSNYLSVGEQSAIRAGDGGFNVSVAGKTTLTGGQITSTQAAIDNNKNSYEAKQGTETKDLQNSASYSAQSISVGVGTGSLPGQGSKLSSAGFGTDSGNASSTTTAGISGVAGNTQARTGDKSTSIAPIFDKDKTQKEVAAQVAITSEFGKQVIPIAAKTADQKAIDLRRAGNEEEAKKWDEGGAYRTVLYTALGGLTGGAAGATGAAVNAKVIPVLGEEIAKLNLPEGVRQMATQVVSVAVGSAAGGAAGVSTALPQTAYNYVSHSPFANVRKTVSQENARLMNQCGANCTGQDFKRIDQQMAKLEVAGNLTAISQNSKLTTEQALQLGETVAALLPVYGTPIALYQAVTGKSLSGQELGTAERVLNTAAAALPLGSAAYKLVTSAASDMAKMSNSIGAIQGFKSAEEVNGLMNTFSKAPAWKEGTQIAEATMQPGTKVQMVVDKTAYDKLTQEGQMNFVGNWATFDNIPNQAFARNNLAITNEFKKDVGYVVELEIVKPVNAQIGVVGKQGSATGGANQLNFLFEQKNGGEFFKVVGQRKLP